VALALGLGLFLGLMCFLPVGKWLALAVIDEYRSEISPVKGFHCAYATLYGGPTCSAYGKQAIRERGLFAGCALLRARFRECEAASRRLEERKIASL
jgi:putative component of membrane protein insertase Oxa1/YidC/SpoIIIJ protein YidD